MLISIVMEWMKDHGWNFSVNDMADEFMFVWLGDKRMFGLSEDCVIIPSSYYDRVTGFITTYKDGPQIWRPSEPDFFEKLERYINECCGLNRTVAPDEGEISKPSDSTPLC